MQHLAGYAFAASMLMLPVAAQAVEVGRPAPEFVLQGPDRTIRLAEYRGKFVYLDFWASWCGPCRQSFPWMNELQAKYGKDGLVVVAINVDQKRADADKFLAERPPTFTVVFDAEGVTPKAYAIKAMPSSMLIGPDGTVQFVHHGFREEQKAAVEAKVREAIKKPQKNLARTILGNNQ